MKGYLWTGAGGARPEEASTAGHLAPWEAIAVDAVGNVIEFWGFKRNQGRVWALLYLRGEALTAGEIERELGLSKGGVSMLLRDLERWGVIQRVRLPSDTAWRYGAESDLIRMVIRVIEEREAGFISRIRADLGEARRLATEAGGVPREAFGRLEKMALLAEHTERALKVFIKTARLDVGGMFGVFRAEGSASARRGALKEPAARGHKGPGAREL
ncbi:MarR family transcriptional regulator [Aggregicoccus sp. 17bor-14]|uniref:GbsR/MarR family transcriptional regulator n=1 Tax=Myxococcaceae TaxID=31 RepID=UPI00129C14FD|nr:MULTISPECIES: MarR family transcriptional regulator [Myxococcaceae]MBF5040804.1 MarR family transcriptional regulator [Simulacricoccus sp. 17bor-14]MRI86592.1 MarR family transcriptional regulator [Aggregicoccus sp. 17bor-14]